MPLPTILDVQAALIYYHAYMLGPYQGRIRLFRRRGLKPRMVMADDWEVFAAILLRQEGVASLTGPDLGDIEVKSAVAGGAFEYQYHKNSWREKLEADRSAGHVFIWHQDELRHVEVWYADGPQLDDLFTAWEAEKPYSREGQQRFRKQGTAGWVRNSAIRILEVQDGEATFQWPMP